jgi:hypothetical protein
LAQLGPDVAKLRTILLEALDLLGGQAHKLQPGRKRKVPNKSQPERLSYSLNIRAFMKRYGKNLSGPGKFTLLLARLANGKVGFGISLKDIETQWNKMTGVMGAYNPAHSTRAKERGWLDTPKYGIYSLSADWIEVIRG